MSDRIGATYRIPFASPRYYFEMGPIRPPSEGQDCSLLIRVNRNCPWNRCLFCSAYRYGRFEYRSVEEVLADIAVAKTIADGLKAASWALGNAGSITQQVVEAVVRGTPEVYGGGGSPEEDTARFQSLIGVANWLVSGGRTVFLQDADAPIMRVPELLTVLRSIGSNFPIVERITSYARSKTIAQRSLDDMKALRAAGLTRLHIGLESGCDEVLAFMDKGVTSEEQIAAGQRAKAAGMELSEYFMPGLGGRRWSRQHALDSARVLGSIDPDFIRLRSLILPTKLDLYQRVVDGEFKELGEDDMVAEIALFVEQLDCHGMLVSDQMSNLLPEIEGQLPEDKRKMLDVIARFQAMAPLEQLEFRLQRRLRSYLAVNGRLDPTTSQQVALAMGAIESEASDAAQQVDRAITSLKQAFR